MTLTHEELTDAVAAVRDFVRAEVAPVSARPECPASADEVARIVAAAREMGLVGADAPELGIWASPEPGAVELTKRILLCTAETNAGIACHLATVAGGAAACRELGFAAGGDTVAATGGPGRGALGSVLGGGDPTPEDSAELDDLFGGDEVLIQVADGWSRLLVPRFTAGAITWELYQREVLDAVTLTGSHGLDETSTWRVSSAGAEPEGRRADAGAAVLCRTLCRAAVSMMVIATGTTRGALARAREYAGERRQGGRLIRDHPAVRLLLGQAEVGLAAAEALLDRAEVAADRTGLRHTMGLRAAAHPLLCRAATDALQVFGGYGYMRDVGMEKILRDNQHLRLLHGTPREICLFLGRQEDE